MNILELAGLVTLIVLGAGAILCATGSMKIDVEITKGDE
jgi:hypothetical protein